MKKNETDEELLSKLYKASVEMNNTPSDDSEFKQKYLNTIAENKQISFRRKTLFLSVASSFLIVVMVLSFILFIPNKRDIRYTDEDKNVVVSLISIEDLGTKVPDNIIPIINYESDSADVAHIYESDNNELLAFQLQYIDASFLFTVLVDNFDYSKKYQFQTENAVLNKYDNYSIYQTVYQIQNGRRTILDFYVMIKTDAYEFYLYKKNSNQSAIDAYVEKIIENI